MNALIVSFGVEISGSTIVLLVDIHERDSTEM